jgi:hypothetical protein
MAAKANMLKMLQEIRGFSQITNRRPPPRSPGLVLTQMRAFATGGSRRRRKLAITINAHPQSDIPHQVRIVHVHASAPAVGATRPA